MKPKTRLIANIIGLIAMTIATVEPFFPPSRHKGSFFISGFAFGMFVWFYVNAWRSVKQLRNEKKD